MPKEKADNIIPLRDGALAPASSGDCAVSLGLGIEMDDSDPSAIIIRNPDGSIERITIPEE